MTIKTKAYLVHLLTASGAVFAMLALLEAVNGGEDLLPEILGQPGGSGGGARALHSQPADV